MRAAWKALLVVATLQIPIRELLPGLVKALM